MKKLLLSLLMVGTVVSAADTTRDAATSTTSIPVVGVEVPGMPRAHGYSSASASTDLNFSDLYYGLKETAQNACASADASLDAAGNWIYDNAPAIAKHYMNPIKYSVRNQRRLKALIYITAARKLGLHHAALYGFDKVSRKGFKAAYWTTGQAVTALDWYLVKPSLFFRDINPYYQG